MLLYMLSYLILLFILVQIQLSGSFLLQMQPNHQHNKLMNLQLDSLLQTLLSSDNQRRSEAEKYINSLPETNFQEGIDALIASMNNSNNDIAQMAAVLFKKKYLDAEDNFKKITQEKMLSVIQRVQSSITIDRKLSYLKRCCEILVKIYTHLNQIPQILNIIKTFSSADALNIKLALMYLIEIICEYTFDDKLLLEHSGDLEKLFQRGLEDENIDVKTASFKTLTIFLASIQDQSLVRKFEGVLNIILTKCIELVKHDQESGKTAIQSLNDLIETHPKFIKPIFPQLLTIFNEIMEASSLNPKLRNSALHGVYLLCINHESMVRKSEYYKTKMIVTYMKMLSENDLNMQKWAAELNDETKVEEDISAAAQEHLFQILTHLSVKFLLPLFIPYIQVALKSSQENEQLAGLTAMSILTQGSKSVFANEFNNIMALITPLISCESPKVLFGTIKTLGYLCDEFSPKIQLEYGQMILNQFLRGLRHNLTKIQYKSVLALQNFCSGVDENPQILQVFSPFMDQILQQIYKMLDTYLKQFNFFVINGVINTLNSVSTMGLPFSNYYNTFMPILKQLLMASSGDDTQKTLIRQGTIQCMGCLLASIKDNKQLFVSECGAIMESILSMSDSLDKNDPLQRAIFTVYENVVEIVKGDFAIYAPRIIDRALYAVNVTVDCRVVDDSEMKEQKNKRVMVLKSGSAIEGIKNIMLNTDSLHLKLQGARLLRSLCQNMGQAFCPYVQKTLPTVTYNVTFGKSKDFRQEMIAMVKFLVLSCQTAEQRIAVLNQLMHPLGNELSNAINGQDDQQISLIMEVVLGVMPHMNEGMLANMPKLLTAVLNSTKNMVAEAEKGYSDKDMDQQLQTELDEQIQQIEEIYGHVQEIIKLSGNRQQFVALKSLFPKEYEFDQQ